MHMEQGLLATRHPPAAKSPYSWASEALWAGVGLPSFLTSQDAGVNSLATTSDSIQAGENSGLCLLLLMQHKEHTSFTKAVSAANKCLQ